MDWMILGSHITLDPKFFADLLSIIVIDLVLAGDNAVIIAMAVRKLPRTQRVKGIAFGAGAAVLLRVILTFFISQLLMLKLVKLLGGLIILWIAVKLYIEGVPEEGKGKEAATFWQAIRLIIIADITMSTDNVLAVAGASHGSLFLLLFGLVLSIPLVVFSSNLLSMLMDKYPVIILIGAVILGRVGGEMIINDPLIDALFHPGKPLEYAVQAVTAVGVLVAAKFWIRWRVPKRVKGG